MYKHFFRKGTVQARSGPENEQREALPAPVPKKDGRRKLWLLGLCVLVWTAVVTGCHISPDSSLRSGEYAGRLSLPDGGDIPCAVALEADGNALKGREIRLPFDGSLTPEAPLSLDKKALGQPEQITAGGLALTLTLEDRPPQSEISDYEAARRAERLCLAVSGDTFYHTGAFSCARQAPGEPARYFSGQAEAKLYGLSRCPYCLTEGDQPLEQASDQQPEADEPAPSAPAEPAASPSASSQPAAGSRPSPSSRPAAASQPSASQPADTSNPSETGQTCKGLLCRRPSLPGYDYCATHKCKIPDCGEYGIVGGKHCERHACRVYGCPYPNSSGFPFSPCEEHTCHYPDCKAEAVSLGGYCRNHLCRHPSGCQAGQVPGNAGFCEDHRCAVPDCPQGVYNGTAYCEEHLAEE